MSGRYYNIDQRVLANCGTRKEPEWIPGIVIDIEKTHGAVTRPYQIRLERMSDGRTVWWFPPGMVAKDTPANRRNMADPHP